VIPRPPLDYPDRPLHHFLTEAAARHPEGVALRIGKDAYSFRELDGLSNAFANALIAQGIRPGSRVASIVPNGLAAVLTMFGASKCGASSVLLNPRWRRGEIIDALHATCPQVIVAAAEDCDAISGGYDAPVMVCADDAPPGWQGLTELVGHAPGLPPDVPLADLARAEAILPFSSGTTGKPKPAVHTHRSIVAGTIQWQAAGLMRRDDRMLLFLPLFHVYGVITLLGSIGAGATMHLMSRFSVVPVLRCIEDERITITFGASPVAAALAEFDQLEQFNLHSLRYFVWGATPMDTRIAREVTNRSGVRWLHAYGATEAPLIYCNPADGGDAWRLDSPGFPVSDVKALVVDPVTRKPLPPGGIGELLIQGPQVFAGYLGGHGNDAFELGWLRTGDIGWLEPGGRLHIVDRAKEMIKVNAFQVAPAELEQALLGHADVADCGVFGVPDDRTGEAPVAAVSLRPGADVSAGDLLDWVSERVASYKRLRRIYFVPEIPRTASGKILRRSLRETLTS
jgi:long-chain acyl-CoA synthetase